VQKWSQKSSPKNKSKEGSQFAKTFWRGRMTFLAMSSQVMKHGSTNTTLKRRAECKMEDSQFTTTKKIPSIQIKSNQCCWPFLYITGIFHYKFVPTGQTVNQVYYSDVLKRLREKVRRK